MKSILLLFFTSFILHSSNQKEELNEWIEQICIDQIEYNDLEKYSYTPIKNNVIVNFVMVEKYIVEEITDDTFTIFTDTGKGEFCNHLTFKYTKKNGKYYLVFGPVNSIDILGKKKKFIDPWIKKVNDCN